MGRVRPPVLARACEGDAFLVAGKLDEFAQLLLSEHLQGSPEELNVQVCLHQTHLIHGVSLHTNNTRQIPQAGSKTAASFKASKVWSGLTVHVCL